MKLSLIVAIGENNVIGINGKMPWNLKSDLDSLGIYYYETDIDSINNHGGYKISLYYNYGEDFHFIREDFDGKWSHKMGYSGSIERVKPSERIFKYNLVTTYEIVKPNIRKLLR